MTVKKRIATLRLIEKLKMQPKLAAKLGVQIGIEKKKRIVQKSVDAEFGRGLRYNYKEVCDGNSKEKF